MRFLCVILLCAACAGPDGELHGPDAGATTDATTADAAPSARVGGWRMSSGDASRAHRSAGAGPTGAAARTIFAQHPSTDDHAGFGNPIVDELGTVYVISYTPQQPRQLVAFAPTGVERWRANVESGWTVMDLALGPDGHLYAVASRGSGTASEAKLVSWDAATGAARPGSPPIAGLARILLPPDGRIYALTYTQAAGYGLAAYDAVDTAPRWTLPEGGDAYAVSPGGEALAFVAVPPAGTTGHTLVVVDPADGRERWRRALDPTLTSSPVIAIDHDGASYVSMSRNGRDLYVMKYSAGGDVLWSSYAPSLTWPRRILIGAHTVTVACQAPQYQGTGITVHKSDGQQPFGGTTPCGEPQAIDANDVIYWGCDGGVQAATPTGQIRGGWEGRYTFQVVLGPDGAAYHVPAAYFADHQLIRIK
jgi:hypothetical protein